MTNATTTTTIEKAQDLYNLRRLSEQLYKEYEAIKDEDFEADFKRESIWRTRESIESTIATIEASCE